MIEILSFFAAALIFMAIVIAGWLIGKYNTFRGGQQDIKTQFSNIKTEYQRRADLFMNLVESVKSYKKFEKTTLVEVIQARSGNLGKSTPESMKKMKSLDGVFSKLLAVFEQYPKLQANEQHNALMNEIRITEDRINVGRTEYNEIVGDYNKLVTMFPSNLVAGMFKFPEVEFFENEASTTTAPKITLD